MWRLSDSGLLRGEVEDLQIACEATLATANASLATMEERGGNVAGAQLRWVAGLASLRAQWDQCLLCMACYPSPACLLAMTLL